MVGKFRHFIYKYVASICLVISLHLSSLFHESRQFPNKVSPRAKKFSDIPYQRSWQHCRLTICRWFVGVWQILSVRQQDQSNLILILRRSVFSTKILTWKDEICKRILRRPFTGYQYFLFVSLNLGFKQICMHLHLEK